MTNYSYLIFFLLLFSACHTPSQESGNIEISIPEETKNRAEKYQYFDDYIKISSKEELIAEFGEENLQDDSSWRAEGTILFLTTTLTNPDNGHIITYVWRSLTYNNPTDFVEAHFYTLDSTQVIKTSTGAQLGMSIQELIEWNGADFEYLGFGWDYEGAISPFGGSKLEQDVVKMRMVLPPNAPFQEEIMRDTMLHTKDLPIDATPFVEYFRAEIL